MDYSRDPRRARYFCFKEPVSLTLSMDVLSDEILALILNDPKISLQNRIHLRAVSSRWLYVIEKVLKEKTQLTIREHDPPGFTFPNSSTHLVVSSDKYFNVNLFEQLHRLFPLTSELTVFICTEPYFTQLPEMLAKFRKTLKSFTFLGRFLGDQPPVAIVRVANVLNSLTNLTRLCVSVCDSCGPLNTCLPHYLAPTLGRLEHFLLLACEANPTEVNSWTRAPELGLSIMEALSDRCTSIRVNEALFGLENPRFALSLTYLHLFYASEHGLALCRPLAALTSLTVDFSDHSTYLNSTMMRNLAHLKHLTDLRMTNLKYLNDDDYINGDLNNDDDFRAKSFFPPQDLEQTLDSLKRLYLSATTKCVFECTHICATLVDWMPNLEELNIKCPTRDHEIFRANLDAFRIKTAVSIELLQ